MNPARDDTVAEYLDMMDRQRAMCFALTEGISHALLWWQPTPREWSIGENLDHLRVFNACMLRISRVFWISELPWAKLRRHRPCEVDIENHYARPDFPMNTGWIWPPRYTPDKPVSFSILKENLAKAHQQIYEFYSSRDLELLGHVNLYDPVMGGMNLIQALRLGVYHDELHYSVIEKLLVEYQSLYANE